MLEDNAFVYSFCSKRWYSTKSLRRFSFMLAQKRAQDKGIQHESATGGFGKEIEEGGKLFVARGCDAEALDLCPLCAVKKYKRKTKATERS